MAKRFGLGNEEMIVTIDDRKITLHRVVALKSFNTIKGRVHKGDIGGWVEREDNISQYSNSWVFGDSIVLGDTELLDNSIVSGNAVVGGDTVVLGNSRILANATVYGSGLEINNCTIYSNAIVGGSYYLNNINLGRDVKISQDFVVTKNSKVTQRIFADSSDKVPIYYGTNVRVNFAY